MLKKLTDTNRSAKKTRLMDRTAKGVCEAICLMQCNHDYNLEATLLSGMRF